MSRTKISGYLIHNPEEVEQNAKRYDHLCELTEKIVNPVIRKTIRDIMHILFNDNLVLDQKIAKRDAEIAKLEKEVARLSRLLPEPNGK